MAAMIHALKSHTARNNKMTEKTLNWTVTRFLEIQERMWEKQIFKPISTCTECW